MIKQKKLIYVFIKPEKIAKPYKYFKSFMGN